MSISNKRILEAARWIQEVALARIAPGSGRSPGKGYATYREFCDRFGLGDPYHNRIMDEVLLEVMRECERRGGPDLAALVIHEHGTGQRTGPGDGWYLGHNYQPGDIPAWEKHRDDCWVRVASFTIP